MTRHRSRDAAGAALAALALLASPASAQTTESDPGPMARALWLVQRSGTPEAADPARDIATKARLAAAIAGRSPLTPDGADGLMDPATFSRIAGKDGRLDDDDARRALEADAPATRRALRPEVREYADLLTTSYDRIDPSKLAVVERLAAWIAARRRDGEPADVVVVCTGNSRRSMMGATLGNVAAAYHGLPEVRFSSGGTDPSAINPRAIAAIRAVGIAVEPTGDEAPRGAAGAANPAYRVAWGEGEGMQMNEFSKRFDDPANPASGFAAIMVCAEADAECPFVPGADLRLSSPFLDPKMFDDGAFEAVKYAERRDDLGRLMLAALGRARYLIDHPEAR